MKYSFNKYARYEQWNLSTTVDAEMPTKA